MLLRYTLFFCLLILSINTIAQTYKVSGRIADFKDTSAMIGVTVVLRDGTDTTINTGLGTVTDASGKFSIDGVNPGEYIMHLEYLGYKPQNRVINVIDKNFNAGVIAMKTLSSKAEILQPFMPMLIKCIRMPPPKT